MITTNKEQALRYNTGKLEWDLVDFKALEPGVQVLMYGAKKYTKEGVSGAHNWKKGLPTNEICSSLLRHLFAYMNGEDNDPESGLPHIGHMIANVMFLSHMTFQNPKWDTRFKPLKND